MMRKFRHRKSVYLDLFHYCGLFNLKKTVCSTLKKKKLKRSQFEEKRNYLLIRYFIMFSSKIQINFSAKLTKK